MPNRTLILGRSIGWLHRGKRYEAIGFLYGWLQQIIFGAGLCSRQPDDALAEASARPEMGDTHLV